MKSNQSISTKFIFTFLLIGVIPLVLFGLWAWWQLYDSTLENKQISLKSTAEIKLMALEVWLDEVEMKSTFIRNIAEIRQLSGTLAREAPGSPLSVQATDLLDNVLKKLISVKGEDKIGEDYTGFYIFSPEGKLKYSLAKKVAEEGADFGNQIFITEGRSRVFFSDVMYSPVSGNPCLLLSAPVSDNMQVLQGILVLEISTQRLNNIIGSGGGGSGEGQGFLVNSRGDVISSLGAFSLNERVMNVGLGQAIGGQIITGEFEALRESGKDVIAAYVPFKKRNRNWVIVNEVPLLTALNTTNFLLFQNLVGGLALCLIIYLFARSRARAYANPLITMTKTARLVSDGDLRDKVQIASSDEIGVLGQSFNVMIDSLASINRRIIEMAQQIEKTSVEILKSAQDQEHVTLTQSSAMSETSATIEELSISAKQVAQSAQSIMQQVEGTAAKILYLSQKAQEINKISTVIEEVAHQIHLLSLNASIEAARAGEHGKGFEVVASEIRKLSEKSNKQTTDIAGIVEDIQNAISSAVLATEQAVNGVRSITLSVQQQDTATDQISIAMQDINHSMKKSIEGTKRTLGGVEELKSIVRATQDLAGQFKLD